MAIPVVAASSVAELDAQGLTVTGNKPIGTAENEMLFALHGCDASRALTQPSGFTSIDATNNGVVCGEISSKQAGPSEPATYSASANADEDQILFVLRITGFDPADAIHQFAVSTGNGTSPTCPTVTTTKNNCLILRGYVVNGDPITTEDDGYPAGTTGIYNRKTAQPGSVAAGIAREDQVTAGSTGTAAWSVTSVQNWIAWTVAIPEEAVVGGSGGGIFSGSNPVTAIYAGSTSITKVYDGALQIWPTVAGPNAVNFDGVARITHGPLTGAADSKSVLGSVWLRTSVTEDCYLFDTTGQRAALYFFGGSMFFLFRSTSGQDTFVGLRSRASVADGNWHHLCFSTDGINASAFFDDVEFAPFTALDNILDLTPSAVGVGALSDGGFRYTGDMAQLYLNFGTYLDLTVVGNRRKLVGAGANSSIGMGPDGSSVTGSPPTLFFDGATADWHINKGTGGGFTETGTLTTASVPPPAYFVPP